MATASTAASARDVVTDDRDLFADSGAQDGKPYLQCVPYARQISGIQIYGDAWTWWGQAEGKSNGAASPASARS